jgi:predicted dehydrogenase
VAVPTSSHRAIAEPLLARGVHCLVEKPIAADVAEAEALVAAARRGGAILQVGHVERFNPVMAAVDRLGIRPVFLEVHRLAPYTFRSGDVGVVTDLMIHDLDIVLHLVGEEPSRVDAVGVPVIGPREDIANARLEFPSGCVANVTASRVSINRMRKIRLFSKDAYVSLDYDKRQALLVRKSERLTRAELERAAGASGDLTGLAGADFGDLLKTDMLPIDEAEPLKEEIRAFLHSVATGAPPRVGGADGARALALAQRILLAIASRPVPA